MGAAAPYIAMAAGSALSAYFSSSGENRVGFPGGINAPHMYDPEFADVYGRLINRAATPVDLGPGPEALPEFTGGGLPMRIGMTADPSKYGPNGPHGTGGGPGTGPIPKPPPTGPPGGGTTPPPSGPPPGEGYPPGGPNGPGEPPPTYDTAQAGPQRLAFGASSASSTPEPYDTMTMGSPRRLAFGGAPPSGGAAGGASGGAAGLGLGGLGGGGKIDPQAMGAIQLLMQLAGGSGSGATGGGRG